MEARTHVAAKYIAVACLWFASGTGTSSAADLPTKIPADLLPTVEMTSQGWTATFASEIRYYTWAGDVGFAPRNAPENVRGSGSQLYVPFAMQIEGKPNPDLKFVALARGGWVDSQQTTKGFSGEVSTLTDTQVSSTATYFGFNGVQPFVSVLANIPTGRSSLDGNSANARMDPDLVEIASFGEGWNVGPTVGVNVPLTGNLVVTLSGGYTWRGEFDREDSLAPNDPTVKIASEVDPGEVATGAVVIAYQSGPFASQISGSVSWESETEENGRPLYRPGLRYLISGKWTYDWMGAGFTTLTAAAAHSEKNEVLFFGASSLATEPFNTNSNVYRVGIEHLFPLGRLWVGPVGSYLHRDQNAYDPGTLQFVPAKTRWAAGVVARYAANDRITFNMRAEHVWTEQEEDPAPGGGRSSPLVGGALQPGTPLPVIEATGWQFAFGANVRY
jgi:hypothetical protein